NGVDAAGIGDTTARVAERHDFGFLFGEEAGGGGSGVAKALNRNARSTQRDLFHLACLFDDIKKAASGGFSASFGTTNRNGLAGNDAMGSVADGHGVGIHDPSHGLRVRVDVGRGNVLRRTDERETLAGVAAGTGPELATGHPL